MTPNGGGIRKLKMSSTIIWAFQYGGADGELVRHWLDEIGAMVVECGIGWVKLLAWCLWDVFIPLVDNEWWSWVHGMHGGNEFGNLLGIPLVGPHCLINTTYNNELYFFRAAGIDE